jgi:choline dehydrogenase-like flavoprotein
MDMANLADGLRKMAEMLFESGAVELQSSVSGSSPIRNRSEISQIESRLNPNFTNLMTIHLFGSCPMGENKARCVTNSFGAVHGVPNLHLADASLLCTAPGVNPQGSIMAFVRRNALEWLERNG